MEQRKGPRLPIQMGMGIGIDLGSAYTRIAVFDGCHYGCSAMPSYMAFTNLGVLVGETARKQATENPTQLVRVLHLMLPQSI
ncbi:Chaperone protein DnaK [Carex littledalei]|uniref:Chaperone protein DnaK n=1 Tax=Carex littledalei TaxID=544730 RepID=A0A833RB25_9POAL|nr:Chaperone protein DnaK [Carex littledalei]